MPHTLKGIFGTIDYIVFAAMLIISAAIGVWYAYADRKKNNTQELLMGGRSLRILPVSLSVLASFMSAISLLGIPSEIYRYGTLYTIKLLGMACMIPTTAYLYLPVYYNLGLTSAYEYLEKRFHRRVRFMGSAMFMFHMITYMSVVLYAPALALSEVTGLQIRTSVVSIGLVCTFYTSIGGIKAVVWTDVFQTILMYSSMAMVLIKGTWDLGGFQEVWKRNVEGQRIEFIKFDWDPTIRHTFWSLIFGGYVTWMGMYAANQAMIQRYLTIGTLKGAQRCLWINLPALLLLISMTTYAGLLIYAYFSACDPIGTGVISKPDQLFPRFVMETLGFLPGVPGFFVSGVFSGALSTVSSGVNSLAAVTLEDFIKPNITKKLTEVWAARLTKILALGYGVSAIVLVFVAQQLGGILQAAATIHGIVGGPMLGIFTLGMFFPFANTWGASFGLASGFFISTWFGIGAFVLKPYNKEAPRSYKNCTELYQNVTNNDLVNGYLIFPETHERNNSIFYPYKLSYMWLSFIGFITVLFVGILISIISGPRKDVDSNLLSPLVIWIKKISSVIKCHSWNVKNEEKELPPTILSMKKAVHFN